MKIAWRLFFDNITHDYTESTFLAQNVKIMIAGRIIKSGSVADILGEDAAVPRRIQAPWENVSR